MRFEATVYDSDGKILYVQEGATALAMQGKQYVQGAPSGDMDQFYVSDGVITAKGSQPSDAHAFDYSTGQWVFDLTKAKAQKWDEMKAERKAEEFGTFTWNNWEFQCDADSQARIQAAVQSAIIDSTFTTTWTLGDNSTQSLNATQLKSMGQALADHVKASHDRGRIVRGQIDAATTQAGLEAINW